MIKITEEKYTVQDLMKEWGVSEEEVKKVAEYFEITADKLCESQDEGNLRWFSSYYDFFVWMHEDSSVEDLIQLLWDDENSVNEDQVFTLSNERAVFIYE